MNLTSTNLIIAVLSVVFTACNDSTSTRPGTEPVNPWFVRLEPDQTGLDFSNAITEDENQNVLLYEYFYNGGGIAVADFNNDGNEDVYFTANQQSCKLFLNKGNWKFDDVTATSGVSGRQHHWKTGAVAVDINADGWMDLYLCYSGPLAKDNRRNQLFINGGNDANGVPVFHDEAARYGLDDPGFTTHAAFFDYDRDGDLDALLINHNPRRPENLSLARIMEMVKTTSVMKGVRLFSNDGGVFHDVTIKSGLLNSELCFGLGVAVSDINGDGWPDIYLSNDYLVPDYLYINNGDGTFTDHIGNMLQHMPQFSMGNAIADVNNDGLPDIMTLDMLPEDNRRQKLLFAPDNYTVFELHREFGFHAQFMRNMLQLNNGDGTFSEIGQFAGVSNTDWSWAPLLVDLDNDGWKDMYVTNGYRRDFTNMDFVKYMTKYFEDNKGKVKKEDMIDVVKKMPSSDVRDYLFQNQQGRKFTNKSLAWGILIEENNNGAVYADLDNDGDADLVMNTIDGPATVYRNDASKYNGNGSVVVQLEGEGKNVKGVGAQLVAWRQGVLQIYEQNPSQGFQSSVTQNILIGTGSSAQLDSLRIVWVSGKEQLLENISSGGRLVLRERDAKHASKSSGIPAPQPLFTKTQVISYRHKENIVNDFKRQPLMTMSMSYSGPCIAVGDVNGDGLNDLYVGGAVDQPGELHLQRKSGGYVKTGQPAIELDAKQEDTDAIFFDADGDEDFDLYVCSGGYDLFELDDIRLQDRLYLNDGKGNFSKSKAALPAMLVSTSCVRASDINRDGFMDLFVGGRVVPGRYPEVPRSYLLLNDSKGRFGDYTNSLNVSLEYPGLVTDAQWTDMNSDGWEDLITVGEWMPIQLWINTNGKLEDKTGEYLDKEYKGWWNTIEVADLNKDCRPDIIVGNLGLNSQCKASDDEPAELFFKDFDSNDSVDPILSFYIQGKSYPFVSRDELLEQLVFMRKRFVDYESYSSVSFEQLFTGEELKEATHFVANTFETKAFLSSETGHLQEMKMPDEVQYSPVHAIVAHDFDNDGRVDVLLAGNERHGRLRFGWYDANYGILLLQDETGQLICQPQTVAGLSLRGDVRSMIVDGNCLIAGINDGAIGTFKLVRK